MRNRRLGWVSHASVTVLLTTGACSDPVSVCTLGFTNPIEVEVRDEAGVPAAEGASGVAILNGEEFRFGIHPNYADLRLTLGTNRFGVFDLRIAKDGFRDWVRSGVEVPGNECGSIGSILLVATLEPAGQR
jgi:hypothetical protein